MATTTNTQAEEELNAFSLAGKNSASDDTEDQSDKVIPLAPRRAPSDRLPTSGFFNVPPKASLYHTKRAQAARERAEVEVPAELQEAQSILIKAGLRRVGENYADVADHNAMTLGYAMRYADSGLHVIDSHAIDPRTGEGTGKQGSVRTAKVPRGLKWQERASADRDEIVTFWTGDGKYPANKDGEVFNYASVNAPRNVSIVFPPDCGLFVLDIDGDAGKAALAELEALHGPLPRTAKSVTGSGGWHFIFRASRKVRNTASQIAPGVDIRGDGGQIIAAPSVHKSGNFYQWEKGCAPWDGIADAPEWLEERAVSASKIGTAKRNVNPRSRTAPVSKARSDVHGFENILDLIGDHDDGDGFDGPIYRAACSWFSHHGTDADASDLVETLRDVIHAAECEDGRNFDRYGQDDYLLDRAEQARQFIAGQRTAETGGTASKGAVLEDTPAASSETEQHSEADTSEGSQFEPVNDWLPHRYKLSRGLIYLKEEKEDRILVQAFDVIGRASNLMGDAGAGRIIHFRNENGVDVELTLNMADLIRDGGGGVLETLADAGMRLFVGGKKSRDALLDLFREIRPRRQIATVPRPGWVRDRGGAIVGYLCPTGEYIAMGGGPYRLSTSGTVKDRLPRGTIDGWKDAASAAFENIGEAPPNFFWIVSLSAAFAGPLLSLAGLEARGFNLSGESSKGKTLALMLGTTVWTTPRDKKGVFFTMNATSNALEDLASIGSESFLALDELGAMQRPQDLGSILFGLSTGSGKSRKEGRGAGLAEDAEFLTFAMMTGERSLRTLITSAGGDYKTGISARFPDLDVTAGASVETDVIRRMEAVKGNFGHAGPTFVRWLIADGWPSREAELRMRIDAASAALAGKAKPAQARAAKVFGLVQVAGELACEAGLLPDAVKVKAAVQKAWDTFKESDEGKATEGAASQLDGFRSWLKRSMGRSVIEAECHGDPAYRDPVGWYTDEEFILDWQSLGDMQRMGLSGTRSGLVSALKEIGAVVMSGKNNYHNKLPKEVGGGTVTNIRLKRDKLGLPAPPTPLGR